MEAETEVEVEAEVDIEVEEQVREGTAHRPHQVRSTGAAVLRLACSICEETEATFFEKPSHQSRQIKENEGGLKEYLIVSVNRYTIIIAQDLEL